MDSTTYSDAELMLIQKLFEEHGNFLIQKLRKRISSLPMGKKGNPNLSTSLQSNIGMVDDFPRVEFEFPSYGRFIEIRWHRISQNRKKFNSDSTNKALFNIDKGFKRINNVNWYSKVAFGSQKVLIAKFIEQLPIELLEKMKTSIINNKLIMHL